MSEKETSRDGLNRGTAGGNGSARLEALQAIRGRNSGRASTVDVAYWAIRDALRERVLKAGDRLVELDLAAALDMSRTPIREALRRLEAEGLVENAPRRGLVVTTLSLQDLIDLFEIDEVLEGYACRRAAQRMSPAEIDALGQTVERMEAALAANDLPGLSRINHQFHGLLRSGAKNGRLLTLIGKLPALRSYLLPPERAPGAVAEHRAIYEAIAARDPDEAERRMRVHTQNALRGHVLAHNLAEQG